MDCSMPCLHVHHQLLKFTQTHVHWVSDAIQPSHSLSPPLPLALNHSQHQGFLQWVGSLHQGDKVLELQLQHQSVHWIFRANLVDLISFLQGTPKSLLQHHNSKASTLQPQTSSWPKSHIHTWLLKKNHNFDYTDLHWLSDVSAFSKFICLF